MAGAEPVSTLIRKSKLEWYGHVCRREKEEDIKRTGNISVECKNKRGRTKYGTIRWDITVWSLHCWNISDRIRWRSLIELIMHRHTMNMMRIRVLAIEFKSMP